MFEAMAAAKPVILGVEGEAKEILLDARAGIAVPPDDPDALAKAILRLCQHPELGRALGANGRRAVREKYSRPQQARAYLELLAGLVSAPRGHTLCQNGRKPPEPTPAEQPRDLDLRGNDEKLPRTVLSCGAVRLADHAGGEDAGPAASSARLVLDILASTHSVRPILYYKKDLTSDNLCNTVMATGK